PSGGRQRAERTRQTEQLQRLGQLDGEHALAWLQAFPARLLLVLAGADLHERSIASETRRYRPAGRGIGSEFPDLDRFLARHGRFLFPEQALERLPEGVEDRHPFAFTARNFVEFVFHVSGEV